MAGSRKDKILHLNIKDMILTTFVPNTISIASKDLQQCECCENEDNCYGLAGRGTKAPRGRPSPHRGAEENGKKQAETGGSG